MAHFRADLETVTRHGFPCGESGATGAGPECWVKRRRRGSDDEQVLLSLICSFHGRRRAFQRGGCAAGGSAVWRGSSSLPGGVSPLSASCYVSLRTLPFTAVRLLADSGELERLFRRKMNTVPIQFERSFRIDLNTSERSDATALRVPSPWRLRQGNSRWTGKESSSSFRLLLHLVVDR